MKKILFVYHASNIGGGTYCLLNILRTIERSKYKPLVLLRAPGDLVNEIKRMNIEVYYFPNMILYPYNKSLWGRGCLRSILKQRNSFSKFRHIISKLQVDLVYINTMMLAPYLKEAKKLGLKTCIHLREHWPLEEHKFQLHYLQNIISNFADEIVAINKYAATMVPLRNPTIVYDWIDMSNRFKEMSLDGIFGENLTTKKVFLFTGGIQMVKGSYEIVKIFRERIIGQDKRLLVVGASYPSKVGMMRKIKYYLSKIGINSYEYKTIKEIHKDPRIKCIPAVYELEHLMQQAYCNLSYFTIPHANLAMAESIIVGCIPVAVNTPESIEYSNNGEAAVLYELGNADDMLRKLAYLDANYSEFKNKVKSNSKEIEKMFDPYKNAARLNTVFDKLFKTQA